MNEEEYFNSSPANGGYAFGELFAQFVAGTPIKRKGWGGYWIYKNGDIFIYTAEGDVINFNQTNNIIFTISHFTMFDWEVATKDNCLLMN
jgi:hypothetical protein